MQLSSTADDDKKKREKEEVKSCCIFFSLSHGPTQFYYSRWGNLRALTKWESIIRTFQSSVVPSSATQLNLFFFFPRLHGMNFHNNGNRSVGFYRFIRTSHKKKKPHNILFYVNFVSPLARQSPSSTSDVNCNWLSQRAIGGVFFFFLSCVLQPDLPYGRAVGCCCWTQEPSRKYLKESRQS